MDAAGRTVRGIRFTFLGTMFSAAVQLVTLPVFARLIGPHDYGTLAGIMVILTPLTHLLCGGIERALIVVDDLPVAAVDSTLMIGSAAAAVVAATLGLTVWTEVPVGAEGGVVLLLAPLVMIAAAAGVFRALLRRRQAFGRLVLIDLVAQLGGVFSLSVVGLSAGWNAYALAAGVLAQATVQLILYAGFSGHRLQGRFDRRAAGRVLAVGLNITKTSMIEVLHGQMPSAMIGWVYGPTALGLYSRAYSLIQLPAEFIVGSVTRVAFVSLAQLRRDQTAMAAAIRAVIEICAALLLPICAGMAAASNELVATVLGPQWHESAALIPWLCLATATVMLGHVVSVVNEAALKLRERFRIQLATTGLTAAALGLSAACGLGLAGAACAVTVGAIFYFAMNAWLAARTVAVRPGDLLAGTKPGVVAAAACAMTVFALGSALPATLPSAWLLAVDVAACGLATLAVYAVFFPRLLVQLASYAGARVKLS